MKRVLLLVTVALMLASAMALSGVAQAAPTIGSKADAKCLAEAVRTLQPGFNPSDYTFHGGTESDDIFDGQATEDPDVFCGFGGDDQIGVGFALDEGDIFLGGAGNDDVDVNLGTFNGGAGDDFVSDNYATFNGGEGNDSVFGNAPGATFVGGEGFDSVLFGPGPVDGP
jgi:Ca2+-binding RTX toxin-like protein